MTLSRPESTQNQKVVAKPTSVRNQDTWSVRGFRYCRQWAADFDYLKTLPEDARKWLQRFAAEYYDADNKLLRGLEKHLASCTVCRGGEDCGQRPVEAIHNTQALRREMYRDQKRANRDVHSRGQVNLWEDYDGVDTAGTVSPTGRPGHTLDSLRARFDAGDNHSEGHGADVPTGATFTRRPKAR